MPHFFLIQLFDAQHVLVAPDLATFCSATYNDHLKDMGSTQAGLCDTQHMHQATSKTSPQT